MRSSNTHADLWSRNVDALYGAMERSRVRLLATDLDGTLLRDDLTLSLRTREALRRAQSMGVPSVPVTASTPMLQWAEWSVAVANAHPDVLQACDAHTTSNNEDGLAELLGQLAANGYVMPRRRA